MSEKVDVIGNVKELKKVEKNNELKEKVLEIKKKAENIAKELSDAKFAMVKKAEELKLQQEVETNKKAENEVKVEEKVTVITEEKPTVVEEKPAMIEEVKIEEKVADKSVNVVEKAEKPVKEKVEEKTEKKTTYSVVNDRPNYNKDGRNQNNRSYNQNGQNAQNGRYNQKPGGQFQNPRNPRPNQNQNGFNKTNSTFNKDKKSFTQTKKTNYVAENTEINNSNTQNKYTNKQAKKKTTVVDEKKTMNKRTLLKKGYIEDETLLGDQEFSTRKLKKNKGAKNKVEAIKITSAVVNTEVFPIKTLSEKIGKTSAEIVKQLFALGIMKTINDDINFDEAELVASELGVELTYVPSETFEDKLDQLAGEEDDEKSLTSRPPVVTIMGHVDHGKTTLLDYIRKANVASGEAGGITQHIGAYTAKVNNQTITFLDTPGHEAFTSMRLRGAQATDVAIIVVAADDGIMPQTVEAINHAKIAGVEIIIAITKVDKPEANPDRILQQLTEHDLLPEAWGGNTPVCQVSAKTGQGVSELLETVLLVAEMLELKANPNRQAQGIIIEAKLDKGRGPVATVLVQNGTLKVSDFVVAGTTTGKIRAMFNSKGQNVKVAGPSTPVSVLGFSDVPSAGDRLIAVEDEKLAKQVAEERKDKIKSQQKSTVKMNLEDMMNQIAIGDLKELKIVVKADVQGSVEAVKQAMEKLSNDEVKVKVIHGGAGAVNESDVMLAETSGAIIIAFNVRPDTNAKNYAEKNNIDIRTYRVIYDAIDDVENAMKGMLAPKFKEVVYGTAEVRETFKVSNVGTIAGCMVTTGKVVRSSKLRLVRDGVIITEGEISSLKRFKDDVKEVAKGYECGLGIEGFNDIKVGDVIESYNMEQINE